MNVSRIIKREVKNRAIQGACFVVGVGLIIAVAALPYIVKDNG